MNNNQVTWPQKMLQYGAMEFSDPIDILESLPSSLGILNSMFRK